jgi:DNA-binding CsgD family transcriptional regulator
MMDEATRVSLLIGDIYDAALDPSLWPHVLQKTCGYIGGLAAGLLSQDSAHKNATFHVVWGDDPHYTRLYNQTYSKINPTTVATFLQAQVGQVIALSDVIPIDEYLSSQFYKEWVQPQGYLDGIQATLEKSATSYAAVILPLHEKGGWVDEETRHRLRLLTPHFRRAVAIGKVIDLHKVEAAALADTLDGLKTAVFLVGANGRLVHTNTPGHVMLADGQVLRGTDGKLSAQDPRADRVLHEIFANAELGDAAAGRKGNTLVLTTRGGERFLAHVLPLISGARREAGVVYSAVAAVFVCKAALELPHPLETISETFKLTPAEMRVLMMIVQLGGVPEVAPVLGISEPTVKTHLQHIFDKTGAKRQADLVKLVAGYMSPLGATSSS